MKLSNGMLYTGITNHINRRMNMHRLGRGSKLVAAHLPFELVYLESSTNRSEATKRELQIKKLNRTKKLELIKK